MLNIIMYNNILCKALKIVLKIAFLAILVASLDIASAQNYCNPSLCGNLKHIACNNSGNFAARCRNASMLRLTQAQKNLIVREHNNKRNQVAGGRTKLQPACRMATMQWDNELARMADLNVKQCQMKHDACRNTNTFRQSGQSLALVSFQNSINIANVLRAVINTWYTEIRNVQMSQINKFPRAYKGPVISHFTVIVADRNIRVGCAVATYGGASRGVKYLLMACNYATTTVVNREIYSNCSTAASGCKTGKNSNFPNLCSTSESYSV